MYNNKSKIKDTAIIILLGILLGGVIFALFSFTTPKVEIEWKTDKKLSINDYTIVYDQIDGDAAATSCTGMKLSYDSKNRMYLATAVFDKSRSYWNPNKVKRPEWVLNHEQIHFDITQFVATKLNKLYMNHPEMTNRQQYAEFTNHDKLLDSLQTAYDVETDHSMDSTRQYIWNRFVNSLQK